MRNICLMTLEEVKQRLEEHFRYLGDGRALTPDEYLLEQASLTMFAILDYAQKLINKFGSLEAALDAEKVTRCDKCYYYDPENLLCNRYGLERPILMIDQGYCSCGVDREVMNEMLEKCRANGGWCTPGVIITADEMKRVMERGGCHDE